MHTSYWKRELRNLAVALSLAALCGAAVGSVAEFLLTITLAYVGHNLYQLYRIQKWLGRVSRQGDSYVEPPTASGVWGEILDGIYRQQRQGQREMLRLQAVIDYLHDSFASLSDAAVMVDERGAIEWSNHAAELLLGLRHPDDVGQLLVNLVRTPRFVEYFERADFSKLLSIRSPVSTQTRLQVQITIFGDGNRLVFARDVTENYRLQQMRKQFVANVSHELRTPLTVISGYLETLSDDSANHILSDESRWRAVITQMLRQARRMESLIKDLILLSRLESVPESTEHEVLDVGLLLNAIREEVLAAVPGQRTITIDADPQLLLLGTTGELHSAVANLVMNAAKYTADGGVIDVSWRLADGHAVLAVGDNGIGIDAEHIPHLTERFYRVDKSRSIESGGTGLGLAIVKHVLLRHQAELLISSEPGKGSKFSCRFPLARTQQRSKSS